MRITFDDKDLKRFERDLKIYARKALPFATKDYLNSAAFAARKAAQATIGKTMINRARGKGSAQGSIRVNPTKTLNMRRQRSAVGSTARFMERQEFGFTERSGGKHGVPLITSFASGEGMNTIPRKRVAKAENTIATVRLRRKGGRRMSRKQRTMASIKQAAKSGNKFVFLELRRSTGIFKILGTKKKPIPRMVADLSTRTHAVKPHPWLKPSINHVRRQLPALYLKAMRKQIHRHKIFSVR